MDEMEAYLTLDAEHESSHDCNVAIYLAINRLYLMENILLAAMHEINNRMSVVQLQTEALNSEILQKNINQITVIIRSLQKYTNAQNTMILCQLNDCIDASLQLCQPAMKNHCIIKTDLVSTISKISADPDLLKQALLNILFNCIQLAKAHSVIHQLHIATKQEQNIISLSIMSFPQLQVNFNGDNHSIQIDITELFNTRFMITKKIIELFAGTISFNVTNDMICFIIQFPA